MRERQHLTETEPMQQAFGAFAPLRDAMSANWENYWRHQDQILESMQQFTQGWFERRHEAARSALAATRRCCETASPTDMVREMQNWTIGSMQRIAHDCQACQAHLMQIAEISSLPPSVRDVAGKAKSTAERTREAIDRSAERSKAA